MDDLNKINIQATQGYRTALVTGELVPKSPKHMVTELFYRIYKKGRIRLLQDAYVYAVATYTLEFNESYAHSYIYQKEQNWSKYKQDLTPYSYTHKETTIEEDCYIRLCIKRVDGQDITKEESQNIQDIIEVTTLEMEEIIEGKSEQSASVIKEYEKKVKQGVYVCALLSDSHYTVNGTWEDTIKNLKQVHQGIPFASIIHLGDLTDGMVSKVATTYYVKKILADLNSLQIPLYLTMGNHDTNYFQGNKDIFSRLEQRELYFPNQPHVDINERGLYYIEDIPKQQLRFIFLESFNPEELLSYGYDTIQLDWLQEVLNTTPNEYKVVIFSHLPPLKKLDFFSLRIRNEERLIQILDDYNQEKDHHILAFIHGHTHADYVYYGLSFPVISIGCNKYEYFIDKKPIGAITPKRKYKTNSQDLWDVLIIDGKENKLEFIRYGAGESKTIDCTKRQSSYVNPYLKLKKTQGLPMIWAHRGASGYAPENTMIAFKLAMELEVDGIELDVQYTKDKKLVVLHDERIDRTSTGSGFVVDFTLEELKKLEFNRTYPRYANVQIPTLEEVLELIKSTQLMLNIELKNSINFYPGMEEDILALVKQFSMQDRVIYSSFNHESMVKIKQIEPMAKTAFLYTDGFMDIANYSKSYGMDAIHPSISNTKYTDMVKKAKEKKLKVNAWTANQKDEVQWLAKEGVDAIITNYPHLCREWLSDF